MHNLPPYPETVPHVQADRIGGLIGCNLRPGMTPGGFAPYPRWERIERHDRTPGLGEGAEMIREAARVVLEGRKMVRAEGVV